MAITVDGHRIVSVSHDENETLRVWDLESGETLRTLEGHTSLVTAVAVTPDGRRVVSASADQTLRVWDLESGQTLRTLESHTDIVTAVAVTPDGRRVVSASTDRTLRVWDLETGEEIASFTGDGGIPSCAFAPNGRTIIAGDYSGRVHFLRLVEADKTKPAIGETKIPLLLRQQQSIDKSKEPPDVLPTNARAVFISYAHADNQSPDPQKRWLDRFAEFLQPLVSQEDFTLCSDQDIRIGEQWHERIQTQLKAAKAVVLLVSPAFLASSYVRNSELPVILKSAADNGVKIFPILVAPSLYKRAKYKYPDPKTGPQEFTLSSIQAANPPTKTLVEMTEGEQNRVLLEVAEQLADLLNP
jgi:TIR domain/WD domain, G-beta repeat